MERARRSARVPARAARIAWDQAADVWEEFQESGNDFSRDRVHGPALLRMIGPVRGLSVLDLGCGQGRFTRLLARRGARVTGIDWSAQMIGAAARHENAHPLGIRYLRLDARALRSTFPGGRFDLAVGCMSLMVMPDLPRVLRGVRQLLRTRGRLVFSVSHPVNTAAVRWELTRSGGSKALFIDGYFDEGPGFTEWRMRRLKRPFDTPYWHRSLESWFRLLQRAGFEVRSLSEPRSTAKDAHSVPGLSVTRRVPFFLVLACQPARPSRPAGRSRQRDARA